MAFGDLKFGNVNLLLNPTSSDVSPVNRAPGYPNPVTHGAVGVGDSGGYVFDFSNYLTLPQQWNVGTGAYSFDGIFFYSGGAPSGSAIETILYIPAGGTAALVKLYWENNVLKTNIGGVVRSTGFSAVSAGTYHITLDRDASNNTRVFVDGVLKNNFVDASNYTYSGDIWFGANNAGTEKMNVELLAWRVTRLADRYTAAFTPPTAPYPDYYRLVTGQVKNESGTLINTAVYVYNTGGLFIAQFNSNSPTGTYKLKFSNAGEFWIVVQHPKFFTDPSPQYNHRLIRIEI